MAPLRLIDESRDPVAGSFDIRGAVTAVGTSAALAFTLGSAKPIFVLAAAAGRAQDRRAYQREAQPGADNLPL